jgi:hypothetical protein
MNNESIIINNNINTNSYIIVDNGNNSIKYDRMDSNILFTDENNISATNTKLENINVNIYRYKLSPNILQQLLEFAKLHQYDDRVDFKENWMQWLKENEDIINREQERLYSLRYNGDIIDKMFKSARYYLRQKSIQKKEPQSRTSYICIPKEMLDLMDNFIKNNIHLKPKDGFLEFCNNHKDLLKECILKIYNNGIKDSNIIQEKIKKTYKNRYFKFLQK